MNHKRRRPKDARSGCLLCKPHKSNGRKDREVEQTLQERRARITDHEIPEDVDNEQWRATMERIYG